MGTKRTKTGQKKHDTGVLKAVRYYEDQGFKVKADLPDHKKPKKIGGYIPDVIATKGPNEVVVEVETKASMEKDTKQREAFDKYADKNNKTRFRTKIV